MTNGWQEWRKCIFKHIINIFFYNLESYLFEMLTWEYSQFRSNVGFLLWMYVHTRIYFTCSNVSRSYTKTKHWIFYKICTLQPQALISYIGHPSLLTTKEGWSLYETSACTCDCSLKINHRLVLILCSSSSMNHVLFIG